MGCPRIDEGARTTAILFGSCHDDQQVSRCLISDRSAGFHHAGTPGAARSLAPATATAAPASIARAPPAAATSSREAASWAGSSIRMSATAPASRARSNAQRDEAWRDEGWAEATAGEGFGAAEGSAEGLGCKRLFVFLLPSR